MKATMYRPTTRLLTILELLQARPQLSAAELARRLEIDARTVRRYVTMLQDMGIPIEATHGRYGGYRLRPGYKLPPLIFTEEEALAVTLGLSAARWLGLSTAAPATEGALAKLERVLPVSVAERIRTLRDIIGFTRPAGESAPVASDVLLTVGSAAQQRQRIRLRYRAADGTESKREVDPYGLVFHEGRWYLTGLDHRSGERRTFRIDRVLEAEPLDEAFQRPAGFDAVAHLLRALAAVPWGSELEVLFETTLAEARLRVPEHIAALEETPAGVLLRTQSDDVRASAQWIVVIGVSIGCRFIVLRPPELREAVRRLVSDLLETHGRIAAPNDQPASAPGPRPSS